RRKPMQKRFFFVLLLCLLSLALCGLAEEEESSFQVLMNVPTPAPTQEPAEDGLPAVPTATPAPEITYEPDGSVIVTLSAVGDVTIGRNVQHKGTSIFEKELTKQSGDINFIFRNVKDIFIADDLTIVNFEGVLADDYTIPSKKRNNDFLFLGPPSYAEALTNNSVEVATIENNHIDDFGEQGRQDTQAALSAAGIQWADEYHSTVYEVQGVRIAILSYKTFDYYSTLYTKVPSEIAAAKAENDLVIVAFHWGAELDYAPNANQQKLGRMAVDAGADLVLGHHSHRINPIEYYHGKYIVYSLANCSFAGNNKPSDMFTFIFQTRFRFRGDELIENTFRIIPARISSRKDYNDFAITPLTENANITTVLNSLKTNGKKLKYAVDYYPLDWE
ncbi:MAG: CapA family protein, partial [Clostridia bacterium]|nr:CapA family protein [Clostridia bacterium]